MATIQNGRVILSMRIRWAYLFCFCNHTLVLANIETKLVDELEPLASAGGIILDWHTCELFPERWADLVVVLRCDHTRLWERLEKRFVP